MTIARVADRHGEGGLSGAYRVRRETLAAQPCSPPSRLRRTNRATVTDVVDDRERGLTCRKYQALPTPSFAPSREDRPQYNRQPERHTSGIVRYGELCREAE